MRTVHVVISCDVDPDRERLLDGVPSGRLGWRGVSDGIPALKESVRGLLDHDGREPVFTWFLRADEQIREMEGEYGWFARARRALLDSLRHSGDELGWHPHFWRRDPVTGAWYQELDDRAWQLEMLRAAHADLLPSLGGDLKSVRMGWSYHNNETCAALEELGIEVDLSAIPGFRTLGDNPPKRSENLFDWHTTPRAPYHPSRADYRRPARDTEPAQRLLEVPSFVSTAPLWGLVSALQLARKTGQAAQLWYGVSRPTYTINVTAKPTFFAPLVAELRRELRREVSAPLVFETHFHADELVPNRSSLYELASVRANLTALVQACEESGARLEFVQARRVPSLWLDSPTGR